MLSGIIAAIVAIFQAIPIISKYFPPKTIAEIEADVEKHVLDEIEKDKKTGRPSGDIP